MYTLFKKTVTTVCLGLAPVVVGVGNAQAIEIEVQGEGRAEITQNFIEVQSTARKHAVRKAVAMAVQKVIGGDALDNPKIRQKFDDIVSQFEVYKLRLKESSLKEGTQFVTTVFAVVDDGKFRQTISDLGAAVNTQTVRSSAILTIMDEFFTTPTDLTNPAPLREVTVYKYDRDTASSEKDTLSTRASASKASARSSSDIGSTNLKASSSGSLQAKHESKGSFSAKDKQSGAVSGSSAANVSGGYGSAAASDSINAKFSQQGSVSAKSSQKGSLDAKHDDRLSLDTKHDRRQAASSSASQKSSLDYGHFASASESEHEFFTNIKEYQPKNGMPDKQNFTLKTLQAAYQSYDIKILDNDRFRSKFFKDRAISIDALQNSAELEGYIKFAREEARADFFSIGSAIIVDRGIDQNTGKAVCDGMVAIKVYSTDDGEAIASGALSESASGNSNDQCRTNVADKIGTGLGQVVSNKVQEYWKRRQMYGREFAVVLAGEIPRSIRSQFTAMLSTVSGISNVVLRKTAPGLIEYVLSYNGQAPIGDAILDQAAANTAIAATFNNYDAAVDGTTVKLFQVGTK
jgi:hypothetical protein